MRPIESVNARCYLSNTVQRSATLDEVAIATASILVERIRRVVLGSSHAISAIAGAWLARAPVRHR
jgi:hypothetical protein